MNRALRRLWPLLVLAVGCHASGTWVDDQANWQRAFGQQLPPGVSLVRSWYWRSPHFFREEAYYFAISAPLAVETSLREENHMTLVPLEHRGDLASSSCFTRPDWFPAQDSEQFQVWLSASRGAALYHQPQESVFYVSVCRL